jgi:hypothetical protein
MKAMLLALILSSTGFAATLPTSDDSLESILANPAVFVHLPTIEMYYEKGTTTQHVTDVCLEGSELYLKTRTMLARVLSHTPKGTYIAKYVRVTPVANLDYVKRVCAEWKQNSSKPYGAVCVRYEDRNETIATAYDLEVREWKKTNKKSKLRLPGQVLFTKAFSIPLCR